LQVISELQILLSLHRKFPLGGQGGAAPGDVERARIAHPQRIRAKADLCRVEGPLCGAA
jgi:hypothetical protein